MMLSENKRLTMQKPELPLHLRLILASLLVSLAACSQVAPPQGDTAASTEAVRADDMGVLPGPALPTLPSAPLPALGGEVAVRAQPRPQALSTDRVALELLVISAAQDDPNLAAIEALLKQLGTPYDVLIAKEEALTQERLVAADGTGRYQGVVLATNALAFNDGGDWVSAFDADEWNTLWAYERDYDVRQATLYAYPSTFPEDYGLRFKEVESVQETPYNLSLTGAGQTFFDYLQPDATVALRYAYTYLAEVDPASSATPLLEDASGNVVAALSTSEDGRERAVLTTSNNPYLLHTQLLGYGLIDWVTKGVFIGERHTYLHVDVDDWFQFSDRWDTETNSVEDSVFRISAGDAKAAAEGQADLRRRYPLAEDFTYVMAFNAAQAELGAPLSCDENAPSADPLTSMTRCLADDFYWLNHTYTEQQMDFTDYQTSRQEITKNNRAAKTLALGENYKRNALLTGTHSGLGYYRVDAGPGDEGTGEFRDRGLDASNKDLLRAASDVGVRYMGANHSLESQVAACETCGIRHPLEPDIFLIPRYPTNVFYNVTTPEEVVDEYNHIYGPGGTAPFWPENLDYEEYLEVETDLALYHVLSFSPYPHFFHQANLYEYEAGRSLLYDWLETLTGRYSELYKVPLVNLQWHETGEQLERRNSFLEAGASGVWDRAAKAVTLSAEVGGEVFATGLRFGSSETYGGQSISRRTFAPGESKTFRVP